MCVFNVDNVLVDVVGDSTGVDCGGRGFNNDLLFWIFGDGVGVVINL